MNRRKIRFVCLLMAALLCLAGCQQPAAPEETTDPRETTAPEETTAGQDTTAPEDTTEAEQTTEMEQTTADPDVTYGGTDGEEQTEYERYMNSSAEDQQAFYNSFSSPAEFFAWLNKAKQEYEDSRNTTQVGADATVDLGDLGK